MLSRRTRSTRKVWDIFDDLGALCEMSAPAPRHVSKRVQVALRVGAGAGVRVREPHRADVAVALQRGEPDPQRLHAMGLEQPGGFGDDDDD
jgi:hypothetical protein